jgi:transketolase
LTDNHIIQKIADTVRGLSADGVQQANSGHPGMPLGCAEIGAVLFAEILKHDPTNPTWADRDRFILSAGHGSMFLYSLLHLTGYPLSLDDLAHFRQLGSKTPGHPEYEVELGIETTTGPLGQGIGNGVGMALAEAMLAARFNTTEQSIVDHYTYVLCGDGCQMEGISYEAASLAGHLGLGKLILIYDSNEISIEGSTDLAFTESVAQRYAAFGWDVTEIDGHNIDEIRNALLQAKKVLDKPSLIIAKTSIAKGAPNLQGSAAAHGAPLGDEEIVLLKKGMGFPVDQKFYVPEEVSSFFKGKIQQWSAIRQEWEMRFDQWRKEEPGLYELYQAHFAEDLPDGIGASIDFQSAVSTRDAGGLVLNALAKELPFLVGGSADLSPSTKTELKAAGAVAKNSLDGRNIHFGIREHAMGSILNGMSLHRGFRVFGSTFLVFSDYMRPTVRLAALMKQPVVFVFTHDSIFVGEDGPTHQPIEHIEALRVIPNLHVIRPADGRETKAAWLFALAEKATPTALVLSRQKLPILPGTTNCPIDKGGYVLEKGSDSPDVVLVGTGSEVAVCADAALKLKEEGITARVVSIPCRERFLAQDEKYIHQVLGTDTPRVIIEAGRTNGWYSLVAAKGCVIGIDQFGESGPGKQVAEKLGISVEHVVQRAKSLL